MNGYEERDGCLNYFIRIAVVLLIVLGYGLIRFWFTKDESFWIDKNVVDTGVYLSATEPTYVTPNDKANIGKHFRIVCKVPKEQRVRGNRLYFPATDIVSGRTFALLVDEPIGGRLIEADGLICGYVKGETVAGRTPYYPVMRVCSYKKSSKSVYELTAPVQRTVKPDVYVSEQGVSLKLDWIEYRGVLNRVCFTVENQSGEKIYLKGMHFRCGGEELGGYLIATAYRSPVEISRYMEGAGDIMPMLMLSNDESSYAELSILPFAPEDTLEIDLQYAVMPREVTEFDEEPETINVTLSYCADEAPHADDKGDAA